jgi:hypothetical protein
MRGIRARGRGRARGREWRSKGEMEAGREMS